MPYRFRRAVSGAGFLLLVAAGVLALRFTGGGTTPAGQLRPDAGPTPRSNFAPNVVKQGFPAGRFDLAEPEKSDSAWEIEWELTHPENKAWHPPGCVLRIKSARFMWKDRSGKPQWVNVVRMLELAEIYVAYDNGNTAFLDVHDMPFNITPGPQGVSRPQLRCPRRDPDVVQSRVVAYGLQGGPRRRRALDERRGRRPQSDRRPRPPRRETPLVGDLLRGELPLHDRVRLRLTTA